jgi:hypothetical protein
MRFGFGVEQYFSELREAYVFRSPNEGFPIVTAFG